MEMLSRMEVRLCSRRPGFEHPDHGGPHTLPGVDQKQNPHKLQGQRPCKTLKCTFSRSLGLILAAITHGLQSTTGSSPQNQVRAGQYGAGLQHSQAADRCQDSRPTGPGKGSSKGSRPSTLPHSSPSCSKDERREEEKEEEEE